MRNQTEDEWSWGRSVPNIEHLICFNCGREMTKLNWNSRCYLYVCYNDNCEELAKPQRIQLKGSAQTFKQEPVDDELLEITQQKQRSAAGR